MKSLLFLIALWGCRITFGAEVLREEEGRIVIGHDSDRKWEYHDRFCVYRDERQVGCGRIVKATSKYAIGELEILRDGVRDRVMREDKNTTFVELTFGKERINKGDLARLMPEDLPADDPRTTQALVEGLASLHRETSSESTSLEGKDDLLVTVKNKNSDDEDALNHKFMSNFSFGLNYIFPNIQYQQALTQNFTTGVMPIFVNAPVGNGDIRGPGVYLTFTRYDIEPYHGTFLQLGVGYYAMTATVNSVEESFYSPAFMAVVGWRWFWPSGVNFAFGIGAQYLMKAKPDTLVLDFSGVLPALVLDLGFAF